MGRAQSTCTGPAFLWVPAASWEGGFCGIKETEPPPDSTQDIADALWIYSSSEPTAGHQWRGEQGPPSAPRHGVPTVGHMGSAQCCDGRLAQPAVDVFPVGSANWSKSSCRHVIAKAWKGARAGKKEEQDQHFGSRLQLNWIKHNMKPDPKKKTTIMS